MKKISCLMLILLTSLMTLGGCNTLSSKKPPQFTNDQFYAADGTFNKEAAKNAYIALMEYHGCPVYDNVHEGMYVTDFETGKFAEVGLGCFSFMNSYEGRYMQMDIYLLPDQMLPEHYHLPTEMAQAKNEGWMVRYGLSYIVGEGEANLPPEVKVPAFTKYTTEHCVPTYPGQYVQLNRVTARHWQYGGPEGAIITESANYHDDAGVNFTDKTLIMK
ncbi:MAG: hypothetical protein JEZ07_09940 [Phycisphaerae bacterium]|nr:hypothetical protein [Phycisphaerae bacterium]